MRWHPDALEFATTYSIKPEDAELIVTDPKSVMTIDPYTAEAGYPVVRYTRGDVTVVVGFRERTDPTVIYLRVQSKDDDRGNTGGPSSGGKAHDSRAPRSLRELQRRCVMAGLKIQRGSRHLGVYDEEGTRVGSINDSTDRRALTNSWKQIERQSGRQV